MSLCECQPDGIFQLPEGILGSAHVWVLSGARVSRCHGAGRQQVDTWGQNQTFFFPALEVVQVT